MNDTTLLVDATAGDVTITLLDTAVAYEIASGKGKLFNIKRLDETENTVTLVGIIEGETDPVLYRATIQIQASSDQYYMISYVEGLPLSIINFSYIAAIF
jgi:hypothetical protein